MHTYCTQCGTAATPGNRFCGSCGSPLQREPASGDTSQLAVTPFSHQAGAQSLQTAVPAAAPSTASRIVVSKNGRGHFRTLTEAVEHAHPHSQILVQPGTYCEHVLIDKPLEIIGDEERPVLLGDDLQGLGCLQIRADVRDTVTLRRLGFRQPRPQSADFGSVLVRNSRGRLVIEDCEFLSETEKARMEYGGYTGVTCVDAAPEYDPELDYNPNGGPRGYTLGSRPNRTSSVVMRRCTITGGAVGLSLDCPGEVMDCSISDAQIGVAIHSVEGLSVLRCNISRAEIGIEYRGGGVVEECTVWSCRKEGVKFFITNPDRSPVLRGCKISSCEIGVHVTGWEQKGTNVLIDGCSIYGNQMQGVLLADGNTTVRDCRINRNGAQGILVSYQDARKVQATVEDCNLTENPLGSLDVPAAANVVSRNNKIDKQASMARTLWWVAKKLAQGEK